MPSAAKTDTFRVTDDLDLELAKTLGRYEGGRSGKPTRMVLTTAKADARRVRGYTDEVHLWLEQPGPSGHQYDIKLKYVKAVKP